MTYSVMYWWGTKMKRKNNAFIQKGIYISQSETKDHWLEIAWNSSVIMINKRNNNSR